MRLAALLCFALLPSVLPACMHEDSPSNVLGKECPDLLLEKEMVQGDRITTESLEGKVVLFLFYQRECEGSERIAMPRINAMYERYKDHPCAKVFVINTAFDKDVYPYLADIDETRKHLLRMDWTVPVARDLNEKSNNLFTIDRQPGTPQAVVVNEAGEVCAHTWYSEKQEMEALDEVFENLAAGMNCKCRRMPREVTKMCKSARDQIKDGKYTEAWDAADVIAQSYGADETDKQDAEYLKKWIENTAVEQIQNVTEEFDTDPEAAIMRSEAIVEQFKGVTGIRDFTSTVENWRKSDVLRDFVRDRKELEEVANEVGAGGEALTPEKEKEVVDRLKSIADRAGRNVIGNRARAQLEAMNGAKPVDTADKSDDRESSGTAGGTGLRSSSGKRAVDGDSSRSTPRPSDARDAADGGVTDKATNRNRNVRRAR